MDARSRAALVACLAILTTTVWVEMSVAWVPGGWPEGPSSCSLVARKPVGTGTSGPRPRRPKAVEVWMQCNYRVTEISVEVNRKLIKIPPPELFGADSLDAMQCAKVARAELSCTGSIGGNVRIRIPFRVKPRVCSDPTLRMVVRNSGGADCDPGTACPDIGFGFRETRRIVC